MPDQHPLARREIAVIACFLIALLAYLILFFGSVPDRTGVWWAALVPDQILIAWMGGEPSRIGLTDRLFVACFAGLILVLAAVFGAQSLALALRGRALPPLEKAVFSVAVGLSELSLLTLLLGLAGWLHHPVVFWLTFVAAAGAKQAWLVRRTRRGGAAQISDDEPPPGKVALDTVSLSTWLLMIPFVILIALGAMMPPWEFDVREYHLQVPKEWYQAGRIEFLPHNVYGNMPLAAELHAVLGMVLVAPWADWWWGALVGKTVMASFAPLTALGLFAVVRRHASPFAASAAALIYLSIPWVVYVSITGLNEGVVACYALLAVAALARWQGDAAGIGRSATEPRSPESPHGPSEPRQGHSDQGVGYLLLAGFLAGSAAACKYPALLFVVVPLAAWSGWVASGPRWKAGGVFLLAALLACGPWFAKNAALTGNPFYPLWFGGATRTAERMAQWDRAHRVPPDDRGRRYSAAQAAETVAAIGWRSRWLSPLVLPFAALAWLNERQRRLVALLTALLAWVLIVWWLATHRLDRFLVPALPWAAWLAGLGVGWSTSRPWRQVAMGVLAAGAVFSFLDLIANGHYDRRLLVSLADLRVDQPEEPAGPSRVAPAHRYLNRAVPDGKRVLLVGDAQPFDLEVPAVYHTCFDPCIFELWMRDRSAEQRLQTLREQQISHVYFDWSEINRYRSPGNYGFTDWVTRELIWEEFVRRQGILRNVPLEIEPDRGELFEVVDGR